MSSLSSVSKEVEALRLNHVKGSVKPQVFEKAVHIDGTTVFLDAKGQIYSTQVGKSLHYMRGVNLDKTLKALVLLGKLSKAAYEQHAHDSTLLRVLSGRKYAALAFEQNAKELGLQLTKAQLARIAQAKKKGPRF